MNIDELIFDDKNFNLHTTEGMALIERSLREHGAGRSVLIDKDNRLIGGNGVVEAAKAVGISKVKVVEVEGDELVAVKRKDVSLDSKKGRAMALADNATAAADLAWDEEAIRAAEKELGLMAQEWGVEIVTAEQFGENFSLPNGEQKFKTITFTMGTDDYNTITSALDLASGRNKNEQLLKIIQEWVEQRTLN